MTELSVPLTEDEATVLQLAASGQSMIAVGRWKTPTESLLKRGYLRDETGDTFNCLITEAGKAALRGTQADEDKALGRVVDKMRAMATTQRELQSLAEQSAQALAHIARRSQEMTGDAASYAAEQWSKTILDRAKELIRGEST